jgi:hypothetical protein
MGAEDAESAIARYTPSVADHSTIGADGLNP